ncbi:hypothetical protein GQ44DRAFT_469669 [Phaeosphaeriaceae sp. PMI808]|nr:hypothetical protein GQ44DRAFT_469669 [Phaeosphaeriaceae sp. PMI808]
MAVPPAKQALTHAFDLTMTGPPGSASEPGPHSNISVSVGFPHHPQDTDEQHLSTGRGKLGRRTYSKYSWRGKSYGLLVVWAL